jgi:holo-[acyl-carrier protein] synthase
MIENLGVGIDISNISDFKKMPFATKSRFYKEIFQQSEIDYCLKFKDPSSHFAGKFALKEAVKKSINDDIYISKIETFHLKSKPMIKLLDFKNKYNFRASISHENDYAVAIVISELIN